jgi:hypothetical protein
MAARAGHDGRLIDPVLHPHSQRHDAPVFAVVDSPVQEKYGKHNGNPNPSVDPWGSFISWGPLIHLPGAGPSAAPAAQHPDPPVV